MHPSGCIFCLKFFQKSCQKVFKTNIFLLFLYQIKRYKRNINITYKHNHTMIKFSEIETAIENWLDNNTTVEFDMKHDDEQRSEPIFENDDVKLSIVLGNIQKRHKTRWAYTILEFKQYEDISVGAGGVKMDSLEHGIEQTLNNREAFRTMLRAPLLVCQANNLKSVNFSKDNYSLCITKVSNKYVTVDETINAAKFEKRFDSLDDLFNYISYRKKFHSIIDIDINVPESELLMVQKEKQAMERNVANVYEELMDRMQPKSIKVNEGDIDIQNVIKEDSGNITFNICYKEDIAFATYNDIAGVTVEFGGAGKSFNGDNLKFALATLETAKNIENLSGYMKRYADLKTHLRKFSIRTAKTANKSQSITQKPVYETSVVISELLQDARLNDKAVSDRLDITGLFDFKRYIVIEGANKNRRRCDIVVYAENSECFLEEYRVSVEKERITDEASEFLNQYFI